jgi:hypothetical protein
VAEITLDKDDAGAVVSVDGVAVAEYRARADVPAVDTPKPYFHPLRSPAGVEVTGFAPEDHTWHHGLAFAFPRVGPHNLWGGGTYVDPELFYQNLDDQGSIEHVAWGTVAALGDDALIAHDVRWQGHAGEHLIDETREWRLRGTGDAVVVDLATVLRNATNGPLALATPAQRGRPDGGYGGLWLRLGEDFSAPGLFGEHGEITESGASSRTLVVHGLTGSGERVTLGLSFLPAGSPGDETWLYRFEPFSAIGWAVSYVDGLEIPVGGELAFHHRLAILDGHADVDAVRALL